jgi:Subtilase family/Divergent InlB B-repeat domain
LLLGLAATLVPAAAAAPRPLVLIAVVDSGVTPGKQLEPSLIVPGYNALDGSTRTNDEFGHGDDVAATLLQRLSIGVSTSGICVECRVLPVKIAAEAGVAPFRAMAEGLRWAADHGARVINLSYGQLAFSPRNEVVESAIAYALGRGAVVVMSAGNDGSADPAVNKQASDSPGAIVVAAAREPAALDPRSNHGGWVTIAAVADSTSIAAPVVSAAAAQLVSWRPDLQRDDIRRLLQEGCDPSAALDVAWHCSVDALKPLELAGFDADAWTPVQVARTGDGGGTVTASGAEVACGPSCADRVAGGSRVTFTAVPRPDSRFRGWSGSCTGTQASCTVTAGRGLDVTAAFSLRQAALTVRRSGRGSVTSTPGGIRCGRACSALFPLRPVRLVARPARGWRFAGWGGACGGTRPACFVQLKASRLVTTRFVERG